MRLKGSMLLKIGSRLNHVHCHMVGAIDPSGHVTVHIGKPSADRSRGFGD